MYPTKSQRGRKLPFPGSPKQNARRAERTENREKACEKVDSDGSNPTVEGLVEIDVDACDRRRRQLSNVIRVCIDQIRNISL